MTEDDWIITRPMPGQLATEEMVRSAQPSSQSTPCQYCQYTVVLQYCTYWPVTIPCWGLLAGGRWGVAPVATVDHKNDL